ncbi:hypothetical protein QL093DRAFT_2157876 [Fusarium oxysporum]|nr:hypothetical protein QL093DRAFT_2157876 [Fusarium oxysporum]
MVWCWPNPSFRFIVVFTGDKIFNSILFWLILFISAQPIGALTLGDMGCTLSVNHLNLPKSAYPGNTQNGKYPDSWDIHTQPSFSF